MDIINSVKLFSKCYYGHSELIVKYNICLKTFLQQGISEPVFYMAIKFINLKELLESLILVINLKRLLNFIKERDTTWISCDSLHAWFEPNHG